MTNSTAEARTRLHPIAFASRRDLAISGLAVAGILLLLPRLLAFWGIASSLVRWPWQFDFDEGHNLNATVLLAHGTNIYQQNGQDRFISAPYTPLFYVANAPFTWLFGPTFGPGRLISALATVAIALLLACIVYIVTRRWSFGLLAGALWLSISPVIVWAAFYKQDMPALALQLAGLAYALRYADDRRRYWAVLIFATAFFTKQSAVAAAAAVSLWLLLRDWRTGVRFVAMMAAAVFIPFLAADLLLHGGLSLHIIGYQWKPWNIGYVRQMFRHIGSEYWPIIVAATGVLGCAFALAIVRGRQRGGRGAWVSYLDSTGSSWGLIALYALAALLWTCIATGIKGGNYNLLLDGLPPIALLAPLGAGWLLNRMPSPGGRLRMWTAGGLFLLAGLFVVQLLLFADPRTWYHGGWPSAQQERFMQSLSSIIANTPGDLYSEDDYLVLRSGRPVIYDDPSTFPLLAEAGRWDDSVFKQSLRDRRFALAILWPGSSRLTNAERQVFEENYSLESADSLDIYVPRPVPDAPQYPLTCSLALGTDQIRLDGYSLAPGIARTGVRAGDVLHVAVRWRATAQLHGSYASFVHLVDAGGQMLAGHDEPATGAGKPTTAWTPGQSVIDDLAVPVPADVPAGRYRLVVGMYTNEQGTLTTLTPGCSDPGHLYGGAITPGWVDVVGR